MTRPSILFLDDDPQRQQHFASEHSLAVVVCVVCSASACIAQLAASAWDEVWLDHDLEGITNDDPAKDNSGSGVARWVYFNRGQVSVQQFVIHSLSKHVRSMARLIRQAGFRVKLRPYKTAQQLMEGR